METRHLHHPVSQTLRDLRRATPAPRIKKFVAHDHAESSAACFATAAHDVSINGPVLKLYKGGPRPAGRQALRDLSALGLSLHEHSPLLPRAWALRANLSAYDAVYVALAEGLRAPLLTLDAKLAKLAKTTGHVAKIEVL